MFTSSAMHRESLATATDSARTLDSNAPASNQASGSASSDSLPTIDMHRLAQQLQKKGFTPEQAVGVVAAVCDAAREAHFSDAVTIASKSEVNGFKNELSERMFNLTLKVELQQKAVREHFQQQIQSLRNDLTAFVATRDAERTSLHKGFVTVQSAEYAKLAADIKTLEAIIESKRENLAGDLKQMENRLLMYFLMFVAVSSGLTIVVLQVRHSTPVASQVSDLF